MIPKPYIAKWQDNIPWKQFYQVEQDLVMSRILVNIFSDEFLRSHLAFRGGTALHKLYLNPPARYSEDIDLVQIKSGPIKPIMKKLHEVIDFFEKPRKTQIKGHGAKALYRFTSEYENINLRLKIEINCKEHFHVFNYINFPFEIKSEWFSGKAMIKTYDINELLGTKLRALYQRRKGRDLFDLYYSGQILNLDIEHIIYCYKKYIKFATGNPPPTKKEFLLNILEKENNLEFKGDMEALLRIGLTYNQNEAFEWLKTEIIERI